MAERGDYVLGRTLRGTIAEGLLIHVNMNGTVIVLKEGQEEPVICVSAVKASEDSLTESTKLWREWHRMHNGVVQ